MTLGLKLSKLNKDVKTAGLEDLLFHSNYSMFKYHLDTTANMTINGGDTTKTITIPHGLSYVPVFMVYSLSPDGFIWKLPSRFGTISGINIHTYAYADATNIYITWKSAEPYNQEIFYSDDSYSSFLGRGYFSIGNYKGGGYHGALRFSSMNVTGSESITSAKISVSISYRYTGTSDILMKTYGIDEDNTSDFGGDPFGRTQTTASKSQSQYPSSPTFTFDIDVLNMFNEIRQRAGWSSNNAMGFLTFDNSSPSNSYLRGDGYLDTLTIIRGGSQINSFRILVFKDKIHS